MTDFVQLEEEIQRKIIKDRQQDYGDYNENFSILAEMFTIILFDKLKKVLEPQDVGHLMMALKLYRCTKNYKADNYDDLSIYTKMTKQIRQNTIAKKDKSE